MNMDQRTLQMICELAEAPGASGFEDAVVAVARKYAAPIGEIKEDFLRNLYIYRKENTGNKPVLMLDAHADEIGFMVHSIKSNGCLRFVSLGRWSNSALPSTKVLVRNAKTKQLLSTNPHNVGSAIAAETVKRQLLSQLILSHGAAQAQGFDAASKIKVHR